ncbi:hypothetical protein GCM10010174_19460 [Kutzneria viridogrisea]|uniref:Phage tail protein n=2 Tax=Kutzneria TaxID=43356 RepID=W5WFU5_9PSEU|nr:phage tail protein [Kutzneria albida]AHH99476.1 hypothetical protein KALB_6116 [Kutzneria albida DSM 43870]MBA8922966.1 phage tail-like protein [Kutzneria viridogrisea]
MPVPELVQSFRFQVRLDLSPGVPAKAGPSSLGDGAFAECGGLQLEMEVKDRTEGGRNDSVLRSVGRVRLQPLVLKRGMFVPSSGGTADSSLWMWLQNTVAGVQPVARYDGTVQVYDTTRTRVLATWTFSRGLPAKVVGPTLNARTGEIALEELHIAHEGLFLAVPR